VLLDYSNPLAELLWEMYREEFWASRVMDWNEDGIREEVGSIVARLCEEVNFEVVEIEDFTVHPDVPCGNISNTFFLSEDGSNIVINFWAYSASSDFAVVNFNTLSFEEALFEKAFIEYLTIYSV